MSCYTLADFVKAAKVTDCPEWFGGITMPFEPYKHQLEQLQFAFQFERVGDFSDAGTGKTLPMQAYSVVMAGYGNKVVVVMPPKLLGQFEETFEEFFQGIKERVSIHVFRESKARREKLIEKWNEDGWPDILLMSYNTFKMYADVRKTKVINQKVEGSPRPRKKKILNLNFKTLQKAGYNVLVADEAHALKNPSSGNHDAFWEYIGESEGEVALYLATGSPIPNELIDAYGLIRLLTPDVYQTKGGFERIHAIRNYDSEYREIIGYTNHEILNENLYKQARRVTKQEAYPDLKDPIINQMRVQLSKPHKDLYDQIVNERYLELPSGEYVNAVNDQKMRMLAMKAVSCPEAYTDKKVVNELRDAMDVVMDSIGPANNKIIIFSYFKETVASLAEHYAEWNPAVINGDTKDSEAERKKFLEDDSCRVIIMNWAAGGVGLNLQIAEYVLFAETPTVPMEAYQAIARSHRGGQLGQVVVWFFRAMKTICAKRIPKLLNKDVENNRVVKDKHNLISDLMGEYDGR